MDYQVLIADSALADLQGIVEFVAQDDRDAARIFVFIGVCDAAS